MNELALPILPAGARKREYPTSESSDAFPIDSSTDVDEPELADVVTTTFDQSLKVFGLPRSRAPVSASYLRTTANSHKRLHQDCLRPEMSDGLQDAFELPSSPPHDIHRSFAEEIPVGSRTRRSSFDAASFSNATTNTRFGSLNVRAESMPMPMTHINSFSKRPASSSFVMLPPQSPSTRQAISRISSAIEESMEIIDLSDLGLTEVPKEIKDLKDFVTISTKDRTLGNSVQLFLGKNRITKIPPFLFNLENLTVLIMRSNKLKYVPGAIGRLKNLVELGLNGNKIRSFPSQMLELRNLNLLSIEPNPLMAYPALFKRRSSRTTNDLDSDERKSDMTFASCVIATEPRWVSFKHINSFDQSYASAPPLSELCLRTISNYRPSPREQAAWNLSSALESKKERIDHAYEMSEYRNTCGLCGSYMVDFVAYTMEWWNAVLKNNEVPIRREFCSAKCVAKWEDQIKAQHLTLVAQDI